MRILVVDDMQDRHDFFRKAYNTASDVLIQAYDYDNAILELSSTPTDFDLIFLDHDLSEEATLCDPNNTYEKTGSDIAKYIAQEIDACECDNLIIYCHSMNPLGRRNMVEILKKAGFNAIDAAFINMKFDIP